MTTATNQLFVRSTRPANTTSPLLSVLSVILGVNLRETLAARTAAQDDAGYTWGM